MQILDEIVVGWCRHSVTQRVWVTVSTFFWDGKGYYSQQTLREL